LAADTEKVLKDAGGDVAWQGASMTV